MFETVERGTLNAKRSFVLADMMKAGPFGCLNFFMTRLEQCTIEVAAMSATQVDTIIGTRDPKRLRDYSAAAWRFADVDLPACRVWRGMGGRDWAMGCVPEVARLFLSREPRQSRIWGMKQLSHIFKGRLPIIVLSQDGLLHIDDGSHRAVALFLSGSNTTTAWVGELNC